MNTWILLATFSVSAVTGHVDEWNLFHWSKSEEELLQCLNDTKLPDVLDNNIEYAREREYIIERLAYLFHEVSRPLEDVEVLVDYLVNVINGHLYLLHQQIVTEESLEVVADAPFNEDQKNRVKEAISTSLLLCSDPVDPNIRIRSGITKPPRFTQEIPEVAELLNMILVEPTWILFAFSENEYSISLTYSERSLTLIEAALRKMNNAHELFKKLWSMWNRRVRLFYFGEGSTEYLYSTYSLNQTIVVSNPVNLIRRRLLNNETVRDPPVPPASIGDVVYEMTRYRATNWSSPTNSSLFSVPKSASMKKSQYYFKRYMHQFFKRLFAHLKLVERGFTDGSRFEEYFVALSRELLFQDSFNDGYGAYLETVLERELRHEFARNSPTFSSLVRSLEPGDQINEFDLLMMFCQRLSSPQNSALKNQPVFEAGTPESRTTTLTTVSTTSIPSYTGSSSTSSYDDSEKGKGPVLKLLSGKCVPKKQRESSDINSNNNKNPSTNNECKCSQNSNEVAENYSKSIVNLDDSDESAILITTLDSLIHGEGVLSCY